MQRALPRLQVELRHVPRSRSRATAITREVELRNVMAVLPGRSPRRLYVSGHYDTVARVGPAGVAGRRIRLDDGRATTRAPASTTTAAGPRSPWSWRARSRRAASSSTPPSSSSPSRARSRAWSGRSCTRSGRRRRSWTIDGVLNNDIVGGALGGDGVADTGSVRVFSGGAGGLAVPPARARGPPPGRASTCPAHQVRLIARHDRFGRGGDHTAFNQHGYRRRALHGVEGELRAAAHRRRHLRGRCRSGLPGPQRARERGGAGRPRPRPARARGDRRARPAPARPRSPPGYDARLRWSAVAGSGRATASSGARPGRRTGSTSGRWAT